MRVGNITHSNYCCAHLCSGVLPLFKRARQTHNLHWNSRFHSSLRFGRSTATVGMLYLLLFLLSVNITLNKIHSFRLIIFYKCFQRPYSFVFVTHWTCKKNARKPTSKMSKYISKVHWQNNMMKGKVSSFGKGHVTPTLTLA